VSLERIEITPFAVIVGDILQHRRTGSLTVVAGAVRKVLYWSQGELVMAASANPDDSLARVLVQRNVMPAERAREVFGGEPQDAVSAFHETGVLDLSARQTLLREWLSAQFATLFSLDEGTAAFAEDEPLSPDKRVFLQSTAALIIDGIRSITNGLVLRRSIGDLKREIELARDSRFRIEGLPLLDQEREVASSLTEPATIEGLLKRFSNYPQAVVAKVVIMMLALGVFKTVEERSHQQISDFDEMQRDLELLAAIGSNDQRSLRALGFSKQLPALDHYQVLDVPRAATRAQIVAGAEAMRRKYDIATYPPILRDTLTAIQRAIDDAENTLKEPVRRTAYDKLLHGRAGDATIQQRLTQRVIAEQNFIKAKELIGNNDYYGAIVLLRQTVQFLPDHADAWILLGACQERNPKWRRDAAESFQMALSIDPNNIDALISLGDLYKTEGLITRAQTCYDDALKISPENQQAKSRLAGLKRR
jgi:tetratricopeptide (TPR) repeat protein